MPKNINTVKFTTLENTKNRQCDCYSVAGYNLIAAISDRHNNSM